MDGTFGRHPADSALSEAIAREEPSTGTARSSSPPVSTDAEQGSGAEVARLTEELQREQEEKARALAQAERRLVDALAEQRLEMEEEARGCLAEVARLAEELQREQQEKARALAEAERRLVRALAEQRLEMEEETRGCLAEVARIQEELARQRAEIQAELTAIRRQRSENESRLAAMVQPSAHVAHG
jgi:hypothetical protein